MSHFMGWWRAFFLTATDAPAVYGEGAGLMVLSTLALGHRWVDSGEGLSPNIYMLLTGDSSVARKSTAIRFARKAVEEIDASLVGPKDYTMEGLYRWMQVKDPSTQKGRTRFGLFSEEFGSDLARAEAYGGTFREDLCGLYDGDDFTKVRAKSDSITILKPRVNVFGGVAYQMLANYCSARDWDTGFFMRFLFVTPTAMREKTPLQPQFPRQHWVHAISQLGLLYDAWKTAARGLALTPDAAALYGQTLDHLGTTTGAGDDVAPVYVQRLGPNILKIALLYQLDRDPHADIGVDAMNDACNFVQHCFWPSFRHAYKVTTAKEFSTVMKTVIDLAQRPDGITRGEVYKLFVNERGLPQAVLNFIKRSAHFDRGLDSNGAENWKLTHW
ncbi:MAG: DUF3987 domain-containing protein [Minisyncoccia bacterium]